MATKNTAALSLQKSKKVRGYTVSRLPLGGYLSAIDKLRALPGDLIAACFPGEDLGSLLGKLKKIDTEMLQSMIASVLMTAPRHMIAFVAELTGLSEEALLEDANVGLDGLVELVEAFVEVNQLGDFIPAVRRLMRKVKTAADGFQQPNSGSNG